MDNQKLLKTVAMLQERQEYLLGVVLQVGMLADWLSLRIQQTTDDEGNPLIDLKMEEFAAWGQQQLDDIQERAAAPADAAQGINLDE